MNFKLTEAEPVQLYTSHPESLEKILEMCRDGFREVIGSVIVIRSGKVVGQGELVSPDDSLDVYPALSGG